MTLTPEHLATYIGGQMEIQNRGEGYLFRGEISATSITDNVMFVEFSWLARGEGFPPAPSRWIKHDDTRYQVSLSICSASEIGPSGGNIGGGSRICISCPHIGELIVLYPVDGSKLDPARVESP